MGENLHPLEAAAIAVRNAVDSRGLKIILMPSRDIFTASKVRERITDIARVFVGNHQFVRLEDGEVKADLSGEETAARHLALLANLLAEIYSEQMEVAA
jgi:hypothetical protein